MLAIKWTILSDLSPNQILHTHYIHAHKYIYIHVYLHSKSLLISCNFHVFVIFLITFSTQWASFQLSGDNWCNMALRILLLSIWSEVLRVFFVLFLLSFFLRKKKILIIIANIWDDWKKELSEPYYTNYHPKCQSLLDVSRK